MRFREITRLGSLLRCRLASVRVTHLLYADEAAGEKLTRKSIPVSQREAVPQGQGSSTERSDSGELYTVLRSISDAR